jgi:hypothetical protein
MNPLLAPSPYSGYLAAGIMDWTGAIAAMTLPAPPDGQTGVH